MLPQSLPSVSKQMEVWNLVQRIDDMVETVYKNNKPAQR